LVSSELRNGIVLISGLFLSEKGRVCTEWKKTHGKNSVQFYTGMEKGKPGNYCMAIAFSSFLPKWNEKILLKFNDYLIPMGNR